MQHETWTPHNLPSIINLLIQILSGYHCRQAVEKYLKAYLVHLETPFAKKHDLDYLIDLIAESNKEIEQFYDMVETLSGYAVEIRYPDDRTEPSIEEAKAAYEIALSIKEYVVKMIDIK